MHAAAMWRPSAAALHAGASYTATHLLSIVQTVQKKEAFRVGGRGAGGLGVCREGEPLLLLRANVTDAFNRLSIGGQDSPLSKSRAAHPRTTGSYLNTVPPGSQHPQMAPTAAAAKLAVHLQGHNGALLCTPPKINNIGAATSLPHKACVQDSRCCCRPPIRRAWLPPWHCVPILACKPLALHAPVHVPHRTYSSPARLQATA